MHAPCVIAIGAIADQPRRWQGIQEGFLWPSKSSQGNEENAPRRLGIDSPVIVVECATGQKDGRIRGHRRRDIQIPLSVWPRLKATRQPWRIFELTSVPFGSRRSSLFTITPRFGRVVPVPGPAPFPALALYSFINMHLRYVTSIPFIPLRRRLFLLLAGPAIAPRYLSFSLFFSPCAFLFLSLYYGPIRTMPPMATPMEKKA